MYQSFAFSPHFLTEKTSKNNTDFYSLNCLHSFKTENKVKLMKMYVKIKFFVEF